MEGLPIIKLFIKHNNTIIICIKCMLSGVFTTSAMVKYRSLGAYSFHLWLGVDDTPQANAIRQRHVKPLSARTWSPEQYDTHD